MSGDESVGGAASNYNKAAEPARQDEEPEVEEIPVAEDSPQGDRQDRRRGGEKKRCTPAREKPKKRGKKRASRPRESSSDESSEQEKSPHRQAGKKRKKGREAARSRSSSSDEELDNWDMLRDMWPLEQRPEAFRKKSVVRSMRFSHLLECRKQYREQARMEGKGDAMFEADSKLPVKKFDAAKDDRMDAIHEASMLRLPVSEPDAWWRRVPVRREPVFRNIPLKHSGCESIVNELVVVRMHNRYIELVFSQLGLAEGNGQNIWPVGSSSGTPVHVKDPVGISADRVLGKLRVPDPTPDPDPTGMPGKFGGKKKGKWKGKPYN